MRLWRTSRHAPGLHSFLARHRGQSQESLSHCKNGADPRRQGGAKSHRLLGGTEPFHLEVRGKGIAAVSAFEKG